MERIISLSAAVVIFALLVIYVTGYLTPEEFTGEKKIYLDYKDSMVWEVLNDFGNIGMGKRNVKSIEITDRYNDLYAWKENLENGGYRKYRQVHKETNKQLIVEMTDSSYGLTGRWQFDIDTREDKSVVTIKEESKNTSTFWRGLYFYLGSDRETTAWIKYLKVRLFGTLLATP